MGRLAGKTAIVTGGTSGIGLASASLFAAEGAHVFITGRSEDKLKLAAESLQGTVTTVQGDVADLADLDRLYRTVEESGRQIDILFANAGAASSGSINEISEQQFDAIVGVNMRGTLFTVQKALPLMNDGGSIIMMGSIAGVKARAGRSVYSASKAALRAFARTWAVELRDRSIRVNLLTGGPTDTGAFTNASQAVREQLAAQTIRGTLGHPDEIAQAALFLASDASAFVNGTEMFADGGAAQI